MFKLLFLLFSGIPKMTIISYTNLGTLQSSCTLMVKFVFKMYFYVLSFIVLFWRKGASFKSFCMGTTAHQLDKRDPLI